MSRPVIIIGGGGHARVLMDALCRCKRKIAGFVALNKKGIRIAGHKIPFLGKDAVVFDKFSPGRVELVNGIGSVGDMTRRRDVFLKFKRKGFCFAQVVHPSAVIANDVELGEGVQIMAGAVIQTGTKVGANTIINTRASIDHDGLIGSHAHIAPGVTLCGDVAIGNGSFVGVGAVVVQGVNVGENMFIKAASLIKNKKESFKRISQKNR